MKMREFLEKHPEACRDGRSEGECFHTVEEWWDYTARADFLCWVLAKTGMGDLKICKQLQKELKPDLKKHGLNSNIYGVNAFNSKLSVDDYLYSFYNYVFFNIRHVKWADRIRELMGNPFREDSIYVIAGSHVNEAVQRAFEIAQEREIVITFTFNDTIVKVAKYSQPDLIVRDLTRCTRGYRKGPVGPTCAETLSKTDIEFDRLIEEQRAVNFELARKDAKLEEEKRLQKFEEAYKGMEFDCKDQEEYVKWFKVNKDDAYGMAALNFAVRWARASQMGLGFEAACREADVERITGYMYERAIEFLYKTWARGEELRKWHNVE